MLNRLWISFSLWCTYWLPFWPSVPGIGRVEDGDCLFVQSFGRNHFTDNELGRILWNIRSRTKLSDYESFVLLRQQGFDPGDSNRALARYSKKLFHQLSKNGPVIISQWEVVYCLFEMDPVWYLKHRSDIECIWPPEEGYFATAHVKQASKACMLNRGKKHPVEVAHPAMITRAVPIMWGAGISPIVEQIKLFHASRHELWVWDRRSVQPWTRSWENWRTRETLGRVAHFMSYVLARLGLLEAIRDRMPSSMQEQVPGDWIALIPPANT
jgi:hypothetical protein